MSGLPIHIHWVNSYSKVDSDEAAPLAMPLSAEAMCLCFYCSCSWCSAVFGSPSSPLVTPGGTEENWSLYLSHPSRLLSAGWTSSCQPSANLFATSSWFPQLDILLQQKLLKFVYQLLYCIPDFVTQFLQKSYSDKKDPKWTRSKTPEVLGFVLWFNCSAIKVSPENMY